MWTEKVIWVIKTAAKSQKMSQFLSVIPFLVHIIKANTVCGNKRFVCYFLTALSSLHCWTFVCTHVHVYLRECVCSWLHIHTDAALCVRMLLHKIWGYFALAEFISIKNRHRVPKQYHSWCNRIEGVGRVREGESRLSISSPLLKKMITVTCTTKSPDSVPEGSV